MDCHGCSWVRREMIGWDSDVAAYCKYHYLPNPPPHAPHTSPTNPPSSPQAWASILQALPARLKSLERQSLLAVLQHCAAIGEWQVA